MSKNANCCSLVIFRERFLVSMFANDNLSSIICITSKAASEIDHGNNMAIGDGHTVGAKIWRE